MDLLYVFFKAVQQSNYLTEALFLQPCNLVPLLNKGNFAGAYQEQPRPAQKQLQFLEVQKLWCSGTSDAAIQALMNKLSQSIGVVDEFLSLLGSLKSM